MEPPNAAAVVEAALFVLGLAAIHGLRRHAGRVTVGLACVACALVVAVGMAAAPPEVWERYGALAADPAALALDPY